MLEKKLDQMVAAARKICFDLRLTADVLEEQITGAGVAADYIHASPQDYTWDEYQAANLEYLELVEKGYNLHAKIEKALAHYQEAEEALREYHSNMYAVSEYLHERDGVAVDLPWDKDLKTPERNHDDEKQQTIKDIEKLVTDVVMAERAAIEERLQGCAAVLLIEDSNKDQVDGRIHDALMRLGGVEQYHAHLMEALGKLYE